MLGLIWALLVWIATTWVLDANASGDARGTAATYLFVGMILFVLMGVIVTSYQSAQNQLRQTLLFAFLEAEARGIGD